MAKKQKTRQQKIASTLRHIENPVTYSLSSLEKPVPTKTSPMDTPRTTFVTEDHTYKYVGHDLIRTTSITGAIILAELALFLILR